MDDRRHERLSRLITERTSNADGTRQGWAEVVCSVAVERLGIDAAAITIRAGERSQQLVAASDDWAAALEELQYTVGEGPGVAAFRAGEPVLVSRLSENDERWPDFGDETAAVGVGAVFAFPLQAGAIRLGTIDLYRRRPGPLEPTALGDAVVLADLAVIVEPREGRVRLGGDRADRGVHLGRRRNRPHHDPLGAGRGPVARAADRATSPRASSRTRIWCRRAPSVDRPSPHSPDCVTPQG